MWHCKECCWMMRYSTWDTPSFTLGHAQAQRDRSTLQHAATHCSTLQCTAMHCSTLQHIAIQESEAHYSTLQHSATHCSTLQHPTAHCNTLQHTVIRKRVHTCTPLSQALREKQWMAVPDSRTGTTVWLRRGEHYWGGETWICTPQQWCRPSPLSDSIIIHFSLEWLNYYAVPWYVCVYSCIYIYIYICMYVCTYICKFFPQIRLKWLGQHDGCRVHIGGFGEGSIEGGEIYKWIIIE